MRTEEEFLVRTEEEFVVRTEEEFVVRTSSRAHTPTLRSHYYLPFLRSAGMWLLRLFLDPFTRRQTQSVAAVERSGYA